MALSDGDYLREALKKIDEKRTQFESLASKSDEAVQRVIDLKYKELLSISKESMEHVKKILDM
jgi:hypothetical protein